MAQTNELDLFAESPELLAEKRKQQLAMALLEQLSKGAPQPEKTRILAKTPLAVVLMNTVGQHFARGDLRDADQRVAEISRGDKEKRLAGYSSATNELMTSPDKNAAIAKFLASGDPMVRALAQAELKAMREREEKEAERRKFYGGKAGDALVEKGDTTGALNIYASGGQIDPTRRPPAAPAPQLTFPQSPDGRTTPFTTNIDPKTGKQTGTAGSLGNTTEIRMGTEEKAIDKAIGGKLPDIFEKSAATIQQAAQSQQAADRILKLAQDPQVITGFGADPRRFLASAASFFNFTGPDAVSKTQAMLSHIAEQTLDASIDLKGAITEKEWPRLRAGEISYSPPALQELAHIARAKEHNKMILAMRQRNAAATRNESAAGLASLYPIPEVLELDFPPDLYKRMGDGTVRYKGSVQALLAKAPQAAPAGGKAQLSPEETLAEIDRLERELGLKK